MLIQITKKTKEFIKAGDPFIFLAAENSCILESLV
jgi:hypothetical protein